MMLAFDTPIRNRPSNPQANPPSAALLRHALDLVSNGIVFVSRHRWVLYANREALVMARTTGTLCVAPGGECRATGARDAAVLDGLFRAALHGSDSGTSRAQIGFLSGSARACRVVVVAFPYGVPVGDGDEDGVVLLLRTPGTIAEDAERTLATLFGLTASETNLATALCAGTTLQEYADGRGTKLTTVKTQLQRVLEKTGTHRQADVIRLVLGLPSVKAGRPSTFE